MTNKPMLRPISWPEDQSSKGKIYLSSMPGRFEPLDVFLREIAEAGIAHVVCLVPESEIARKSPDYLALIQRDEFPATLWRFEIPDYGRPENPDDLDQMLDLIWGLLDDRESVVIHCAAGHGRTGMVATLLLARMGIPLGAAAIAVSLAGSAPDNQEQLNFLQQQSRS